MARRKSAQVHQAILDAAQQQFEEKGYTASTIGGIAKAAGTAQSNVYVYFPSKIQLAFAVFEPWMRDQVAALEARVRAEPTPEARLAALVRGFLNDIGANRSGHTLTLVQALATARPTDDYSPELLRWTMARLHEILTDCLPGTGPAQRQAIVNMLILAFDGIALRQNLRRGELDEDESVASVIAVIRAMLHLEGALAE